MHLFNSEKDLIHRIANLIFIIWLVVAIFITYNSIIDLVVKKDTLSYKEYESLYCNNNVKSDSEEAKDSNDTYKVNCESLYETYKIGINENELYTKRSLVNSIGNLIIVGTTLYIINKKRV
jgi:hypothetical protein